MLRGEGGVAGHGGGAPPQLLHAVGTHHPLAAVGPRRHQRLPRRHGYTLEVIVRPREESNSAHNQQG